MAVFGFQLIFTIIVLSILNKLSMKYSFARWILTKGGLIRYLYPTNQQIKEAMAQQARQEGVEILTPINHHDKRKNRRKNRSHDDQGKSETFYVPKNLTLALDSEPLHLFHLVQTPFYNELQWLIDFSLCTLVVYFTTEAYYSTLSAKSAANEYNLSIVWCLLSLGFVIKILCSITASYFHGEESIGERSICIVSFCVYLLLAMVILIADEETLEFGLTDAYRNFSNNAYRLLERHGVIEHAYGPSSFLMIKFWLAITCGLIGAFFAFPGLRLAQMHFDALVYARGNQTLTLLHHLAFVAPLLIILAWIKPVARYYLVEKNSISNETFESVRLILILLVLALRFCLFRRYLQSYLNIAPQKVTHLRKQTGKVTNVDVQKLIARVGHYVSVASLQYLTPLLLCLFLALLSKSVGDYRWTGSLFLNQTGTAIGTGNSDMANISINDSSQILNETIGIGSENLTTVDDVANETIIMSSNNNQTTMDNEDEAVEDVAKMALAMFRDVFTPVVLRAFTGFLLWWSCAVWFSTSVVGFVYNSYFRAS